MERVKEILCGEELYKIIISNPFKKSEMYFKVTAEMKIKEGNKFYQLTYYYETKVKHQNIFDQAEFVEHISSVLDFKYKQCDIIFSDATHKIFFNKNKSIKILSQAKKSEIKYTEHNKAKRYILKEGTAIDWLIELGIMNKEGKVLAAKQKKFRQLNKFLEMVQDVSEHLPDKPHIVDIGCGKSYLTFALYYYLTVVKGKEVSIIGLDLKADVVEYCQNLAERFQFHGLNFVCCDIENFQHPSGNVDLLISLHACDTATDYALFNAVRWNVNVILSVPCCQHELFFQLKNETLQPLLKHGILKERFSALLTDSVRSLLLEAMGYRCQVMEFIDMEHTPKNIMIRAIRKKSNKDKDKFLDEFFMLKKQYYIQPKLYELLSQEYSNQMNMSLIKE